jgi:hypothetical protein
LASTLKNSARGPPSQSPCVPWPPVCALTHGLGDSSLPVDPHLGQMHPTLEVEREGLEHGGGGGLGREEEGPRDPRLIREARLQESFDPPLQSFCLQGRVISLQVQAAGQGGGEGRCPALLPRGRLRKCGRRLRGRNARGGIEERNRQRPARGRMDAQSRGASGTRELTALRQLSLAFAVSRAWRCLF